ncbi:FAD-dependent oxidoreductase [Aurantiacibacter sp. MUD11]|uniref:NAD(P)/FAD-dependent oxidoreductase n=1 Tax=Aurantiacibacter sp. MUD11 TaxID=3003265 RepID=UPI0022AB1FB7|nr:FAD-dependent oxidoreductase [Aurantiacibacter sp. MUD11]WAT18711.1 FAD-dependent oxidoreductase [Aurantiacibacter sp. MUD11]
MDIAIIGAGMAGLSCGQRLAEAGHQVRLFDKGRGPGGRMSTRRVDLEGQTLHFDHGAQYFTASSDAFARQVSEWHATGAVARWPAAGDDAWVGTPGMNAPVKVMASQQDVQFGTRIETIERTEGRWWLLGENAPRETFDAVISAVPAEQAAPLLAPHVAAVASLAEGTVSQPCWTLMVAFERPADLPHVIRDTGSIGWAARNSSKPGRGGSECWVVQASPEWSQRHLEQQPGVIVALLVLALRQLGNGELPDIRHAAAHRWRYAFGGDAGQGAVWDEQARLGVCGDWLAGGRVEQAYLSGLQLAEEVLGQSAAAGVTQRYG